MEARHSWCEDHIAHLGRVACMGEWREKADGATCSGPSARRGVCLRLNLRPVSWSVEVGL